MTKQNHENERTQEPKKARRELLGNGTLAAAGAMLGMFVAACGDDDDKGPTNNVDGGRSDGGFNSIDGGLDATVGTTTDSGADSGAGTGTDADIKLFNALLTAEYTAITAYQKAAPWVTGAASNDPLFALKDAIAGVATTILMEHQQHAAALVDAITALNGIPVDQTTVAAGFAPPAALMANPIISNVLKFAASKEKEAAVAYNNTIGSLEAASSRFLASTIEGDETQHFIVLAALVLGLADPGPNLSAANASKVIPESFVHSFNSYTGLDNGKVPDYYA